VASIGLNSTSSHRLRACATAARDERVDARALRVADRLGGALDVRGMGAREPGDHGAVDLARDQLYRGEIPR
jgi:hypothetical protein